MIQVTAAIIQKNGKLLLCQRPKGKRCELLWEFPGGKINPGETPEKEGVPNSVEIERLQRRKGLIYLSFRNKESDEQEGAVANERIPEGAGVGQWEHRSAYAAAFVHLNRRKATLETSEDYSGTGENRHHRRSDRTLTV